MFMFVTCFWITDVFIHHRPLDPESPKYIVLEYRIALPSGTPDRNITPLNRPLKVWFGRFFMMMPTVGISHQ
jgi:hypothetical protein